MIKLYVRNKEFCNNNLGIQKKVLKNHHCQNLENFILVIYKNG